MREESASHVVAEAGVLGLKCGHVHGHRDVRQSGDLAAPVSELGAGEFQHDLAEWSDEGTVFGDVDEYVGWDGLTVGVSEPGERLEADEGAGVGVDDGLVGGRQCRRRRAAGYRHDSCLPDGFANAQHPAKDSLDAAAFSQVGAQAVFEDLEPILAASLRAVHGRVGVLEDRLSCGRPGR